LSGLSTGAKIGIGVGCGIGGLLLLLAFLCIFWLYRRLSRTNRPPSPEMIAHSPEQKYGEHVGVGGRAPIYEKSTDPVWRSS
jgi:hypothetical protein